MLSAFSKLFVSRVPTTDIAGIALTYDEAIQLTKSCSTLKHRLNSQLLVICDLLNTPSSHSTSRMRVIQSRHLEIQACLSSITLKAQNSTQTWTQEFYDARIALERKIVFINRRSYRSNWAATARQSWPGVAQTYAWLLPVAVRLQQELSIKLRQKELWIAENARQAHVGTALEKAQKLQEPATLYTEYPRVLFDQDVTVREYRVRQANPGGRRRTKTYYVKLTDDKKRTLGSFKNRRGKYE